MNLLNKYQDLLLKDEFYEATREPHTFVLDHYKEIDNNVLFLSTPTTKKYIDSIIAVNEGDLDEGEYVSRNRINKPQAYIAPNNVDWGNPDYEKFLFLNYPNFDWINLRKKFWIAFDYWIKIDSIKKHTPQSELYGLEKTSGEFNTYENS